MPTCSKRTTAGSAAAAGAVGRHVLAHVVCSWQALLVANTVGAALLGWLLEQDPSVMTLTVVGLGLCGALTTYSSFALEARALRPNRDAPDGDRIGRSGAEPCLDGRDQLADGVTRRAPQVGEPGTEDQRRRGDPDHAGNRQQDQHRDLPARFQSPRKVFAIPP